MRIMSGRAARVTIFTAVVSSAFACNEPTSGPGSNARGVPGGVVTTSQAIGGSPSSSFGFVTGTPTSGSVSRYSGFGVIQLEVGLFPPGPCMPAQLPAIQRDQTLVSVCAFIENGGGSPLLRLTLTSSRGTGPTTLGIGSFPAGPCRTYLVRGAFGVDDAGARSIANHAGDLLAIFGFQDVDDRPVSEMRGTLGMIAPPEGDQVLRPVGETCVVDVVQRAVVGGV